MVTNIAAAAGAVGAMATTWIKDGKPNLGMTLKGAIAAINRKDYEQAAQEILNGPTKSKGRTLKGLVKRRKREAKLFLSEGKPGALLQRIFFWTGVTAGTIAASIVGWKFVSKKFLGGSDE